ncbi:MAG: DUF4349 domain-containing protein [Bacteroidota bacterium]
MRLFVVASSWVVLLLTLNACGTSRQSYAPSEQALGEIAVVYDASAPRAQAPDANPMRPTLEQDRNLVRNAALDVSVGTEDGVNTVVDEAITIAEQLEGYVASEAPERLQLRIPDHQLNAALDALAALGREERRDVEAADVTMQYADLEIRLANAKALQTRLRDLLEEAESVEDVLAVEVELARVTSEVERLEGRIRYLTHQITYSTVAFSVRDRDQLGPLGYVVVGTAKAIKWLFVRG